MEDILPFSEGVSSISDLNNHSNINRSEEKKGQTSGQKRVTLSSPPVERI